MDIFACLVYLFYSLLDIGGAKPLISSLPIKQKASLQKYAKLSGSKLVSF